ncbi:hypothetical protein ACIO1C_01865 [Streptomyces sp. NPDC087420]|uniref:hypothetical protein n=1 Tax=Streptomyces sp. NPDC087420 TaxID=3365785 RepID=UPI003836E4CF
MDEWADGATGRVMTWPDPDVYVLVDGVLLRAVPSAPGLVRGSEAALRHDPDLGRLTASATGAGPAASGTGAEPAASATGAEPV